MIWEAFLYATARTTPAMRRLGLVGDAIALRSRALRHRRAWTPHEERCRAFVIRAVDTLPRRRSVVVLGSGLARDVPLARLAASFERVVLVDAVHLLPVRWRAWQLSAECVAADLSGGDDAAIASLRARGDVDLVISANLLSQMPLPHRRAADDWMDPEPTRRIGIHHLATLRSFWAPVCLLSDLAYRDVQRDGSASEEHPLVDESLLPPPNGTWDWEVAPRGEIDRGFARIHRVGAWFFGATDVPGGDRGPA